jgi:hypothetical protein
MVEKSTGMIAGFAFAAVIAIGQLAHAADGQHGVGIMQVWPHLSAADPHDWRSSIGPKTSSQRQRMADGTRTLSREIERDGGADQTGEDALATGTSMSH